MSEVRKELDKMDLSKELKQMASDWSDVYDLGEDIDIFLADVADTLVDEGWRSR